MVTETGLKVRMAIVGTVLFGLYLYLAGALLSAGTNPMWVLLGIGGFVAIQYKLGRWLALRSVDAHDLTDDEYPEVHRMVRDLSRSMDLDTPRVMVATMGTPNAFAVGRRGAGVVVLSESLLDILDDDELEGVVAHELAHIDNRDVVLMVLGQAIAALVGYMVFLAVRVVGRRSLIVAIVGWILGTIAHLATTLLVLAMSRYREYVADEHAVRYTRRPDALASALTKISVLARSDATQPVDDNVNALCISGGGTSIFSTHPAVERRISRIAPDFDAAAAADALVASFQPDTACPNCQAAVDPDWSFCEACGSDLDSVAAPTDDATPTGDATPTEDSTLTEDSTPTLESCQECNRPVEPFWEFCESCGASLR